MVGDTHEFMYIYLSYVVPPFLNDHKLPWWSLKFQTTWNHIVTIRPERHVLRGALFNSALRGGCDARFEVVVMRAFRNESVR